MIVAVLILLLSCAYSTKQITLESACPGPPSTGNITGFTGGDCACSDEYYQTQAAVNLTTCVSICEAIPQCAAFIFGYNECYFLSTACDGVKSDLGYSTYIKNDFMCSVIAPTNGAATVVGNGYCYVGNCTVNYACIAKFNLVGASSGICNATSGGALSPSAPTCVLNATAAGFPAFYLPFFENESGYNFSFMPIYIQLFEQWCAQYNSTDGITDDYQLQLNAYLLSQCPGTIILVVRENTQWYASVTFQNGEYYRAALFSRQYIINQKFNVTADVVKSYCQLLYASEGWGIVLNLCFILGYTLPISLWQNGTCFIQLIWAPIDMVIAFVAWKVLHRVLRTHEMPSAVLLKAEIICNALWSLSYELLGSNNLNLTQFIFAPFCFISPYMAVVHNTFVYLFYEFFFPFWSFGALVKSSIALERVLSLYAPVFYHIHANRKVVSKLFAVGSALFWIGVIVFYVCLSSTVAIDPNTYNPIVNYNYTNLVTSSFFITLTAFASITHTICACMIATKLIKGHSSAVVPIGDELALQKVKSQRNISILVLSTTLLNLITYALFIGSFFFYSSAWQSIESPSLSAFMDNINILVAVSVDVNVPLSLILQSIFSTPYRHAFIELYINPFRQRFGSLLNCLHSTTDSSAGAHAAHAAHAMNHV